MLCIWIRWMNYRVAIFHHHDTLHRWMEYAARHSNLRAYQKPNFYFTCFASFGKSRIICSRKRRRCAYFDCALARTKAFCMSRLHAAVMYSDRPASALFCNSAFNRIWNPHVDYLFFSRLNCFSLFVHGETKRAQGFVDASVDSDGSMIGGRPCAGMIHWNR